MVSTTKLSPDANPASAPVCGLTNPIVILPALPPPEPLIEFEHASRNPPAPSASAPAPMPLRTVRLETGSAHGGTPFAPVGSPPLPSVRAIPSPDLAGGCGRPAECARSAHLYDQRNLITRPGTCQRSPFGAPCETDHDGVCRSGHEGGGGGGVTTRLEPTARRSASICLAVPRRLGRNSSRTASTLARLAYAETLIAAIVAPDASRRGAATDRIPSSTS